MKVRAVFAVGVVVVGLLVCGGSSPWQTKQKPKPAAPKAAAPKAVVSNQEATTGPVPPPLSFPNPWPAPAPRPAGKAEEAASALAKTVLDGGPDTLPALERAALECGFSIIDSDGKILYKPESSLDNGVAIADLDLAVAAEGAKRKSTVTYKDLQDQLDVRLKGLPVKELLSQAVAAGLFSKKDGLRFWANFIVELGRQSDGLYHPIGASDDTVLSEPQACLLLYCAAGQAWVAALAPAKGEQPAEPSEQEVEAEDPPPLHGPVVHQTPSLNAAFQGVRQATMMFSGEYIAEYISRNALQGRDPNMIMLHLLRMQTLRVGTSIKLRMTGAPLVRSSIKGNTGGRRPLFTYVRFDCSDEIRRRYEALRQFLPGSPPLPDNGAIEADVQLHTEDHIDADPSEFNTGGTEFESELVGEEQKRSIGPNPVADDYKSIVIAKAYEGDPPLMARRQYFSVPVKDWLDSGAELSIMLRVIGQGQLSYPNDTNLIWFIDREIVQTSRFSMSYATPMLTPGEYNVQDPDRFTSWMGNFDPSTPSSDPDPRYTISDLYIWDGPASGCGAEPGERVRTVTNYDSLPWNLPPVIFKQDLLQWDAQRKLYSFQAGFLQVPVEITTTHAPAQRRTMSIMEEIDPGTPGNSVVLKEGDIKVLNGPKMGRITPFRTLVKKFRDAPGQKTVQVELEWVIERPGAAAGNGTGRPPSAAEQQLAEAKARQMLAQVLAEPLPQPALAQSPAGESLGHGPLWVNDPDSATCAEIILADSVPADRNYRPEVFKRAVKARRGL